MVPSPALLRRLSLDDYPDVDRRDPWPYDPFGWPWVLMPLSVERLPAGSRS